MYPQTAAEPTRATPVRIDVRSPARWPQRHSALLAPEARVLLLAMGAAAPEAMENELRHPDFDFDRLVWLAQKEKATSVLSNALRSLPIAAIPAERVQQLRRLASINAFRMLHLEKLLARSLAALAEVGIEVVLLKGAGLATTAYASFAERPMYDLDVLVKPEQADAAWNALRAMGWTHDPEACPPDFYEEHHHLPPLDDPAGTGLSLELHTAPWAGAVQLPTDAIWRGAREVRVAGQRAWVPCVEHQILHLATHFAWAHVLRSAGWRTLRDLRQLLTTSTIDWGAFTRLATDTKGVTCCYWTFAIGRSLVDLQVPGEVLRRLRPPLPSPMLALLERHYIGSLFHFGPVQCPSLKLGKALWTAGMSPTWSGHGDMRPWDRDNVWIEMSKGPAKVGLADRMRAHTARFSEWGQYLLRLTGGPALVQRFASEIDPKQ